MEWRPFYTAGAPCQVIDSKKFIRSSFGAFGTQMGPCCHQVFDHGPQGQYGRNGQQNVAEHHPEGDGLCRRSEEHTSELQSRPHLVCRLLLEKKKKKQNTEYY